jgi:hypothetical protein
MMGRGPNKYDRYLSLPMLSSNADVFEFWKANTFSFPTLASMAKDYLTVQASSVPSERAFSSGTDLVTRIGVEPRTGHGDMISGTFTLYFNQNL